MALPDDVRDVATELRGRAQDVDEFAAQIRAVQELNWNSFAADRFRERLERINGDVRAHAGEIRRAASAVDEHAERVAETLRLIELARQRVTDTLNRARSVLQEGARLLQQGLIDLATGAGAELMREIKLAEYVLTHIPSVLPEDDDPQWLLLGRTVPVMS